MRVTRRTVLPRPSTIKSRVELLPQSSAATASLTNVVHLQSRHVYFPRHEGTDGVVGPDEKVGQVRVETFDATPRSTDPTRWLGSVSAKRCVRTTLGVGVVRALQLLRVHQLFESVDATVAFHPTYGVVQLGVDQPEKRRHRCSVSQMRFIFDDDGGPVQSTNNHGATPVEFPANLSLYNAQIVKRRVEEGQRQNSSVRTSRATKARVAEWCDVVFGGVATNVDTDEGATSG